MKQKLLLLLTALLPMAASAYDAQIDGIYYNFISESEAEVTSDYFGAYFGDVTIPASVTYDGKTYNVTSIGFCAFCRCDGLTSVTIPESVTGIRAMAFCNCNGLTSITIPNGVTYIGMEAFSGCSNLASISIPESVTEIGGYVNAFLGTPWFDSQPDGLVYAGKVAYFYKGDMPENTHIEIKEGTVRIENYAFYVNSRANLTSVTIPESVTSIGIDAFNGCSGLTSIAVPDKVNCIGFDAFYGTAWYDSQPNGLVYAGKVVYEYKGNMPQNTHIEIEQGTLGIADYAFSSCEGLTSVTIPNSITNIGKYAFDGCSGLTSVIIPESVTKFDSLAFSGCFFLEDSFINNSAQTSHNNWGAILIDKEMDDGLLITGNTVAGCRPWATSVTIPESVTSIGYRAFSGCTGLTSVTIPNSVTSIGYSAFEGCSSLTSITIPNSVTSIGESAFYYCSALTSITIPNSVTYIGSYAFSGCSSLTSITVPNSVTYIGYGAFSGCNGLISVKVEEGNIFYDSHNDCNAIIETASNTLIVGCQNTIIPNNVTRIGDYAFSGCSNLTSITIPNCVTDIGYGAFSGCSSLMTVTLDSNAIVSEPRWYNASMKSIFGEQVETYIIGNNVNSIGYNAFRDCSSLISVTILNSVTSIDGSAFLGCSGLTSITIPGSVTSIGDSAFSGCSGLTSISIPGSVTSIGDYAFLGCSGLTSITVEEGNAIYDSRNNCNAIIETATNTLISGCQNTIIPNNVTSIGEYAFSDCNSLASITIPISVTSIGSGAFSGCSCLTSVNIGNSVTSIGSYAFYNCRGLTSFSIPSSVTYIGPGAFGCCSSLQEIYCYAEETPEVFNNYSDGSGGYDGTFYLVDVSNVLLVVPDDAVEKYKTHEIWGQFWIETPTGIKEIRDSKDLKDLKNFKDTWYSLDGHKLDKPQKGINIIRYADGTTKKVVIK